MFAGARLPFVDLSTGINPHPFRLARLPASAFTRLPEPEDEAALCRLAAASYGAPRAANVVAAPGSQILISLLPGLLPRQRAVVLSPTYGEHATAWATGGAAVLEVGDVGALAAAASTETALVVCNPNNPDGRRIDRDALEGLVRRCADTGALLVVDEAFADLEPEVPQAASLLPSRGLVVLRSFGKTYGLAGLRLGFMLADIELAERMRARLGPWAVSGPAIAAGRQGLGDTGWCARIGSRLEAEAARLDTLLLRQGLEIVGGTRLFRLARVEEAGRMFRQLGAAGILVRSFEAQPHWLRFGLPRDEAAWTRLDRALRQGSRSDSRESLSRSRS